MEKDIKGWGWGGNSGSKTGKLLEADADWLKVVVVGGVTDSTTLLAGSLRCRGERLLDNVGKSGTVKLSSG